MVQFISGFILGVVSMGILVRLTTRDINRRIYQAAVDLDNLKNKEA